MAAERPQGGGIPAVAPEPLDSSAAVATSRAESDSIVGERPTPSRGERVPAESPSDPQLNFSTFQQLTQISTPTLERQTILAALLVFTFFPPTSAAEEANRVESELRVVGFGVRKDGGKVRLLISDDLSRKRLEILGAAGNVTLQRETEAVGRIGLSPNGKFAYVARHVPPTPRQPSKRIERAFVPGGPPLTTPPEAVASTDDSFPRYDFEVLNAAGDVLWRKLLPASPSYDISDSGLVVQMGGLDAGSEFALFNRQGERSVLTPSAPGNGPEYFYAWSRDGESIIFAHRISGKLRCFRGAKLAYELAFQQTDEPMRPNVLGVWDDCGAILTLGPLPFKTGDERLLLISPEGNISRKEVLDHKTYQQHAAIAPDGETFAYSYAYTEGRQTIRVSQRNGVNPSRTHPLPKGEAVDRILFGKNPGDLSLICRNIHKDHPDAKSTKLSGHWIRFVRRGRLSEKAELIKVRSSELVLHDEARSRLQILADDGFREVDETE